MPQTLQTGGPGPDAPTAPGPAVLVTYATRYGSTRGVAERIAATLRDAGVDVTLSTADVAGSAAGYDAVVLGSPVFNQRWLPACERYARDNHGALAQRPVWLFSVATSATASR